MFDNIREFYSEELSSIKEAGLYKSESIITTPQSATINTQNKEVLNFCANNYLGLSSHHEVLEAAIETIKTHGFGMSSVRFICGTQDIHKELEHKTAEYLGTEDCILYADALDANGGCFGRLLGEEDHIISDVLSSAPIIECRRDRSAERYRSKYKHREDFEYNIQSNTC